MPNVPRRTVSELVTLHVLEADLKDVFVEGTFDVAIVHRFLQELGVSKASVRPIGTVEIDDGYLLEAGREANNRERVILLAQMFQAEFPEKGKILCIADRDYGEHLGGLVNARDLAYTDGCCMEAYMWDERCFMRFLAIFCNKPEWDPAKILAGLRNTLESMYALRLSGKELELKLDWIDRNVCLSCQRWTVRLNRSDFAARLLQKIGKADRLTEFLQVAKERLRSFGPDPRQQIHGHDFVRVLSYFLRKKGVRKVSLEPRTLARVMALTPTREELEEHVLFLSIKKFAL